MLSTAYKFISFEKSKSTGILLGIVISIYLIGIELGMFFYLAGIIGGIVGNSNPEQSQIFVVSSTTNNVNVLSPFDKRWVNQLRSVEGVDNTHSLIVSNVTVKFDNGESSPAFLVGSEYPYLAGGPRPDLVFEGSISDLAVQNTVSAEFYDKKNLGYDVQRGTKCEIGGKSVKIAMITKNAKGFSTPMLYTTEQNARQISQFPQDMVSAVIVTVKDKSKIDEVLAGINALSPNLKAWRAEDIKTNTIVNVMTANNMGMSFGTLVIFGIVSGFFIIGLTMYSATYDRIRDYGTLKALGATNRYISLLVVTQSFLYAIFGFAISLILLVISKIGMEKGGLIISLTPQLLTFLLIVTILISVGSSLFSIKKLKSVEPSSIFR